jgi:hypothetical protein
MGAVPKQEGGEDGSGPAGDSAGTGLIGGGSDGSTETVDIGTACEMLGNKRRRYALHCLKQQDDGVAEMGELSTQVAAWERGIDPDRVSYDERKTVHTSLYQHHAPKLDDSGLVEYDSRSGVVELTEAGENVDLYLEAVGGRDVPWSSYLLGVAGVGLLVTLTSFLGAVPGSVPPAAPGVAVGVAFFVSTAVFVYDNRRRMRLGCEGPPPEADEEVRDR